jgi:uncharacterized membrane protein
MQPRSVLDYLRPISGWLALVCAFTAQYFFTGEVFTHFKESNTWEWRPAFTIAVCLLFLSLSFALWAFYPRGPNTLTKEMPSDTGLLKRNRIWLFSAIGCSALSMVVYLIAKENIFVDFLWLAGIVLFLISLLWRAKMDANDQQIPLWEGALVIVLTIIGFGLRYWNLEEIPSHVDNDVALMGTFGLRLIEAGQFNWIGNSGSEHLLSYDQLKAWSMRLFGQGHYGVVMFSVLFGTFSLPLVYLLGRELGGRSVGLISIALQTISYTHIHFSRILFGSSATFFALLVFYFLIRGFRSRASNWYGLAGLALGLGLLTYDSSRVIPVIALSLFLWECVWQRDRFRANFSHWLIFALGALISFGPMLAFAVSNLTAFIGRGNGVMLWTPAVWEHEMVAYQTTSGWHVLWEQVWRTFLTLHLTGDGSPHFALTRPMTSSLTAALFMLGSGFYLTRGKDPKYFLLLAWVGLVFVLGGVLTYDPPYWPHLNIVSPAVAIVAALGAYALIALCAPWFGRFGTRLTYGVLAGAILFTGVTNWQMYYSFVKDNASPRIRIARYLSSLPDGYFVYMVNAESTWNEYAFQFFNKEIPGRDLAPAALAATPPAVDRPIVFILYGNDGVIPVLKNIYPAGALEEHDNNEKTIIFYSYTVAPSGYIFPPEQPPVNPLTLPGWWLVGGGMLLGGGWWGYQRWRRKYAQAEGTDEPGGS